MAGRASCEAWLSGTDSTQKPDQASNHPGIAAQPGDVRRRTGRNKIKDWSCPTLSESVEVEVMEAIRPPPGLETVRLSNMEMARLWQQWPFDASASLEALGVGDRGDGCASTAETGSCCPQPEVEEHSESQNSDAHSEKQLPEDGENDLTDSQDRDVVPQDTMDVDGQVAGEVVEVEGAAEQAREEKVAVEEEELEEEAEDAVEEQEAEEEEDTLEEQEEEEEEEEAVDEPEAEQEEEDAVEEQEAEEEEQEAVEEEEEVKDDQEQHEDDFQDEEDLANEEQEECLIGVNSSREDGPVGRASADPKRKKKKAPKKGNSGNARGRQAAMPRSRMRPPKNQKLDEEVLNDARTSRCFGSASRLLLVLLLPALWLLWAQVFQKPRAAAGRERAGSSLPEHCTTEIPPNIQQLAADKSPAEPPAGSVPRISLYSPCLWRGFTKSAERWAPSAHWSWKQTPPGERKTIELQHPHERALSILNVSSTLPAEKFQGHLFKGLARNIFPRFGELTEENYGFYLQQQSTGLVVLFPDPEAHITLVKAQAHWRPIFEGLQAEWAPRYRFVYTSTMDSASRDWIRKEFGVTHFPAVAVRSTQEDAYVPVHRREGGYSGPWHVFKSDLTYENLFLHIEDIDAGCHARHTPTWTFRGVRWDSGHEGTCSA